MTAAPDPSRLTLPRLSVDPEGVWHSDGEEITHEGILDSLRHALQVDAGGHFLQVGAVRVPVRVADAPYVVVRVEFDAAGATLTLNDLSREPLRPETLFFGPREIPYCRVRDRRFEARFSRAAAWQLLQRLERDEALGAAVLVLPGLRQVIPTLDRPLPVPPVQPSGR